MARVLIASGAVVDLSDRGGRTALHAACANSHGAAVKLLVERGASPSACDNAGHTPGDWAAARGKPAAAGLLEENDDLRILTPVSAEPEGNAQLSLF